MSTDRGPSAWAVETLFDDGLNSWVTGDKSVATAATEDPDHYRVVPLWTAEAMAPEIRERFVTALALSSAIHPDEHDEILRLFDVTMIAVTKYAGRAHLGGE